MKFTTNNSKNGDYQEDHVIYVATQTGSFKRIDLFDGDNPYKQTNIQSLDILTKDSKVTCMNWADDDCNEILIGRGDGVIRTYMPRTNTFCEPDLEIDAAKVVGLAWNEETIVAAGENGKIHILNETPTIIECGDHISKMRQCQQNKKLVAVGGKSRKNNLKIFDLSEQKCIFTTKNVPHDSLQLEVHVWDSDMAFVNDSDSCLATCSRYGYIRYYDRRDQRRPVHNYVDKKELSYSTLAEKNGIVFVGTTMGSLFAFDLRLLKTPLHTYKGFTGAVTDINVDPTGKYLFTSSLDRYVRVHGAETTHLLYQCYVKSKASQILMKNADDSLLSESRQTQIPTEMENEDAEYDDLFDQMATVQEDIDEPTQKKQKLSSQMKRHSGVLAPNKSKK